MNQASLLTRVAATVAAVVLLLAVPAPAVAATTSAAAGPVASGERDRASEAATPIDFTGASDQGAANVPGGGGSLVRTIVGLAIVIGVIYGVAWVLRTFKARRQPQATGSGLAALASVPLANGRSVHLVRAGTDLVLLGVAEQGVVPIRTYTQEEARDAGLVDDDGMLILPADDEPRRARRPLAARVVIPAAARLQLPRPRPALPAPRTAPRAATARPAAGVLDTLRSWTVRG